MSSKEIRRRSTSLDIPRSAAHIRAKQEFDISRQKHKKKKLTLDDLKKEISITEHLMSIEKLAQNYPESNIDVTFPEKSLGLSSEEAKKRLDLHGKNKLTPPPKTPAFVRFLLQFTALFSVLLEIAGILCLIALGIDIARAVSSINRNTGLCPSKSLWKCIDRNNLYLAIVLFLVVFLTACFTYYQESKSEAVLEGFKQLIAERATVIRDGKEAVINTEDLVVGDIVLIGPGDKIPADLRILAAKDFKVDNSTLTGESELVELSPDNKKPLPLDASNLAFFGTWAKNGRAVALVINIGDNTMIGKIAGLAQHAKPEETPLHKEINKFVYVISTFAIILGICFLAINMVRYPYAFIQNFIFAIGIIVANVPEGLLGTVTTLLALTAKRMAKKNVLVKNLESVETLGSTTTIASDKTGTLTQNRMTVAHLWYDDNIFKCATNVYERYFFDGNDPIFKELQRIATLCSNAIFDTSKEESATLPISKRPTIGDASESAVIRFVQPFRDITDYREKNKRVAEIPFSSENKWHLIVAELEDPNDDRLLVCLKGAPERIFKYCSKILHQEEEELIDEKWKKKFEDAYFHLGSLGERVIGFARMYINRPEAYGAADVNLLKMLGMEKEPSNNFTFVGLMSLIDPPREGVVDAIRLCHTAGIRVIMVTGDHEITAAAIARQIGILHGDTAHDIADQMGIPVEEVPPERVSAVVVRGDQIPKLKKENWDFILSREHVVFARTSPQQKLIIVEECQKRNEVVAVTGDGVNDSPALKKANIGIAMGSGSDVSKEAADMILMDDNFASIVHGVEEGRILFDNLKKSIAYTLCHAPAEILPFIAFILWSIPVPLTTILILCIDLGTDMTPAISLAYEPGEPDIMVRPPRREHMVSKKLFAFSYLIVGMMVAAAEFFAYLVVMAESAFPPYTLIGMVQAGHFSTTNSGPVRNVAGRLVSWEEQRQILGVAQAASFLAIVIAQFGTLLACKTRYASVFHTGIRNPVTIIAYIIDICIVVFVIYTPWVGPNIFGTRPLPFVYWLFALPFAFLIFAIDEIRKFFIRADRGGWMERNTAW